MNELEISANETILRIKTQLLNEIGEVNDEAILSHLRELIQAKIKELIHGQVFICNLEKLLVMEKLLNDKGMEESRTNDSEEGASGVRQSNNKKKSAKKADSSE